MQNLNGSYRVNRAWSMSPSNAACPSLSFQLFYLVSVCLCVAIIAAFQLTAFTFRENLVATALLLALFGYVMRNTAAELWFVFWDRNPSGWLWTCCLLHDFLSAEAITLLLQGLLSKQAWARGWMPWKEGKGDRVVMKMARVLSQKGPQAAWQTGAAGNGFSVSLTLTLIVGSNT